MKNERTILGMIGFLALVGLGISIYLASTYFSSSPIPEELAAIHKSDHSTFFGIQIAFLGIVGYVAILAIAFLPSLQEYNPAGLYFTSFMGSIMLVRLMYGSIFVLEKFCPYYAISAAIMLTIFIISTKALWERDESTLVFGTMITIGIGLCLWGFIILITWIGSIEIVKEDKTETSNETVMVLVEGKYAGYIAEFQKDCGCGGNELKLLSQADPNEAHHFRDWDANGDLGSCDEDIYFYFHEGGWEEYTRTKGSAKFLDNLDPNEMVIPRDPNEAITEANKDFQEVLLQMALIIEGKLPAPSVDPEESSADPNKPSADSNQLPVDPNELLDALTLSIERKRP